MENESVIFLLDCQYRKAVKSLPMAISLLTVALKLFWIHDSPELAIWRPLILVYRSYIGLRPPVAVSVLLQSLLKAGKQPHQSMRTLVPNDDQFAVIKCPFELAAGSLALFSTRFNLVHCAKVLKDLPTTQKSCCQPLPATSKTEKDDFNGVWNEVHNRELISHWRSITEGLGSVASSIPLTHHYRKQWIQIVMPGLPAWRITQCQHSSHLSDVICWIFFFFF